MKLINCTPHQINVYSTSDTIGDNPRRLFVDKTVSSPVLTIYPSGVILNAQLSIKPLTVDSFDGLFVSQTYDSVDNPLRLISGASTDDIFIVSALYKTAAKAANFGLKYATVQCVIYDAADMDNPRICGCLHLDLS